MPSVMLPLICFGVALLMAVLMLVAAAVVALTEIIGHAWIATLIVAVLLLVVAWLIYLLWVRERIDYIDKRLETIYDVASAARNGYQVVRSVALRLLDLAIRKGQ